MSAESELQRLIADLEQRGPQAERAAQALVALGVPAVEALLAALRSGRGFMALRYAELLGRLRDPGALAVLAAAIGDESFDVRYAAMTALGSTRAPLALPPLVAQLERPGNRGMAVRSIGRTGLEAGAAPLLTLAGKLLGGPLRVTALKALMDEARAERDSSDLNLIIDIAEALARLGHHELAFVPIELLGFEGGGKALDAAGVRVKAAGALQLVVGRGLRGAIRKAMTDRDREVRELGLKAALFLGDMSLVPDLIAVAMKDRPLRALAWSHLHELLGVWPAGEEEVREVSAAQVKRFWAEHAGAFDAELSYRFGKPVSTATLVERIPDSAEGSLAVEQLQVMTGGSFASREEAAGWQRAEGQRFVPGKLYRAGREHDLSESHP